MNALIVIVVLLYNFSIIAGACYLVEFHQWSLWTIFFAIIIMRDFSHKRTDDGNDK